MDFENQSDLQVQKIIDKKVFNGKTLYLVKWKNYPLEQATWECNKLLINVKDKIRQFKYSKRTIEDIPNIKIEEDMPQGQIRDTFKRKRGRPPRMSFNSYRRVANQPDKNYNKTQNITEINQSKKRGRGRPRGSKNKKPRQIHFEEQNQISVESYEFDNQKAQDKTLSNSNNSEIQFDDVGNKKLQKLKKIGEKLKSGKIEIQSNSQTDIDIVDSEQQVSVKTNINFNLGENHINRKVDLNRESLSSQIQKKSIFIKQQQIEKSKPEQCRKNQESNNVLGKIMFQREIKSSAFQFNGKNSIKKNRINQEHQQEKNLIKSKESNLKSDSDEVNITDSSLINQSSMLSCADEQIIQQKFSEPSRNLNAIINKQNILSVDRIQEGIQLGNKYWQANSNTNKSDRVSEAKQNIKKSNSSLQIKLSSSKRQLNQNQNKKTSKSHAKQIVTLQTHDCSKKVENKEAQSQYMPNEYHQKITKIYYLETIELRIPNSDYSNQFVQNISMNSFPSESLQRIFHIKNIVEQLNGSLAPCQRQASTNPCHSKVPNNETTIKKILQAQGFKLFEQIYFVVKRKLLNNNEDIVNSLVKIFAVKKSNFKNLEIYNQIKVAHKISQQPLYLVEFNQGQQIKKLASCQLLLYLIINSMKSVSNQSTLEYLYMSLNNFTFYIKFLESPRQRKGKSSTTPKIEKSSIRNLKIEEQSKSESENEQLQQQLQQLFLQAIKNIKNIKRKHHLIGSNSTKRKYQNSIKFLQTNDNQLLKNNESNLKSKWNQESRNHFSEKLTVSLKEQSSGDDQQSEPILHNY